MKKQDVLITVLSDTHSGGTTALFPNYKMEFGKDKNRNHTPNSKQLKMYDLFLRAAQYAKANKTGKMVLVHNGDAIEGIHHQSIEIVSPVWDDHVEIHKELIGTFLQKSGFARNKGDRLYYTIGTESHTANKEEKIADELNADGIFQHVEIDVNGRLVWFLHHGPAKSKGANEGNTLRNFLKDIYWSCKKNNVRPPDVVFTGHTHTPCYNTYVFDFHTIHGIICPSFQSKTRYAYGVAPVERNEIGASFLKITADGLITTPFILKETSELVDRVTV